MTIEELREKMKRLADKYVDVEGEPLDISNTRPDEDHQTADDLLLAFVGDKEVISQYNRILRWYA